MWVDAPEVKSWKAAVPAVVAAGRVLIWGIPLVGDERSQTCPLQVFPCPGLQGERSHDHAQERSDLEEGVRRRGPTSRGPRAQRRRRSCPPPPPARRYQSWLLCCFLRLRDRLGRRKPFVDSFSVAVAAAAFFSAGSAWSWIGYR
ncbi:hypothetical protein BHE74_00042818 [Ensete ventricosum]|nr:hypothetical protein GW17_00005778 [Ensete ventricosum]RWW50886.1 hypothetical protein BHE74_00042818 [Ensete ventricosum]RZR83676.1 hypothetical protein BHM03_00010358 [Ensete ventricosum]